MSDSKAYGIELWEISRLKPYENNAKKHPPEQIKTLANLIAKHGWTAPIVVDKDGVIIAGHGRRLASIELGLEKVPVVVRRDLTKAQADALRLADNKAASTSYDVEMLQSELAALAETDIDIRSLGFEDKELEFLTADLEEMDDSFFVDDIQDAVEEKKTENDETAKRLDETAAPLADAFGFRRLSVAQSRRVRSFMNRIEGETGKSGPEALMAFLDSFGVE